MRKGTGASLRALCAKDCDLPVSALLATVIHLEIFTTVLTVERYGEITCMYGEFRGKAAAWALLT